MNGQPTKPATLHIFKLVPPNYIEIGYVLGVGFFDRALMAVKYPINQGLVWQNFGLASPVVQ